MDNILQDLNRWLALQLSLCCKLNLIKRNKVPRINYFLNMILFFPRVRNSQAVLYTSFCIAFITLLFMSLNLLFLLLISNALYYLPNIYSICLTSHENSQHIDNGKYPNLKVLLPISSQPIASCRLITCPI